LPAWGAVAPTASRGVSLGEVYRGPVLSRSVALFLPFLSNKQQQRAGKPRHKAKVQNRPILRIETRDSTNRRNGPQTLANVSFSAYEPGGRRFESCRAHQILREFTHFQLGHTIRLRPTAK
jgi:hypothetical protein